MSSKYDGSDGRDGIDGKNGPPGQDGIITGSGILSYANFYAYPADESKNNVLFNDPVPFPNTRVNFGDSIESLGDGYFKLKHTGTYMIKFNIHIDSDKCKFIISNDSSFYYKNSLVEIEYPNVQVVSMVIIDIESENPIIFVKNFEIPINDGDTGTLISPQRSSDLIIIRLK